MRERFYLISGLDEGYPITPYIVWGSEALERALLVTGDGCRTCEAFRSEAEANEALQEALKFELLDTLKYNLNQLESLTKSLNHFNRMYEKTDDDDRYGGVIQSTKDEIDDVNAEIEYLVEVLDNNYRNWSGR